MALSFSEVTQLFVVVSGAITTAVLLHNFLTLRQLKHEKEALEVRKLQLETLELERQLSPIAGEHPTPASEENTSLDQPEPSKYPFDLRRKPKRGTPRFALYLMVDISLSITSLVIGIFFLGFAVFGGWNILIKGQDRSFFMITYIIAIAAFGYFWIAKGVHDLVDSFSTLRE